jgi:hypothetical protein
MDQLKNDEANPINKKNKITLIYERLKQNWVLLSLILGLFAVFIVYLSGMLVDFGQNSTIDVIAKTTFMSLITSCVVVFTQRFFEQSTLESYIAKSLGTFRGSLCDDVQRIFSSTFKFGLQEIQSASNDVAIISNNVHAKEILWINTKFNPVNPVIDSLTSALESGTNIRLLLMHKDNICAEFRAKDSCQDHDDPQHVETWVQGYKDQLAVNQRTMLDFYRRMKTRKKDGYPNGELKIRFYRDLPAVPVLILDYVNGDQEAYSGFYLNRFSSGMPTIKWMNNGNDAFMINLHKYFERKWHFSADADADILIEPLDSEIE